MTHRWKAVIADTIAAWNRLAVSPEFEGLNTLAPRYRKRTPYWIPMQHWPQELVEEVEAMLKRLETPNIYTGKKVRKLSPTTVKQYRHMMSTLLSAAVGGGCSLDQITSIRKLVHPETVERALNFLAKRHGGVVTSSMVMVTWRARVLASECNAPAELLEELEAIGRNLEEHLPPERRRRRMTPKNRTLLQRLEHDQRFADLIYTLPDRLSELARETEARSEWWAFCRMRAAVAIDLLLTCSFRRENLVELKLGHSLKRVGTPPERYWVIELVESDVKNAQPLRYRLEGPSSALLEEYLEHWRLKFCEVPNDWLFPDTNGQMLDPKAMTMAVRRYSKRMTGSAITPHQFRHISAETFLLQHPDKLDLISEHLGHRDRNTTRHYYARSKQKQASRIYQEHGLKVRREASDRLRRVRLNGGKSSGVKLKTKLTKGDIL